MKTVIWDTETTGLLKPDANHVDEQPRIIEFAGIALGDDDAIIDSYECLINPGIPISDEITRITGIRMDDLAHERPFISHYDNICSLFSGAGKMIAHNLSFDRAMLANELIRIDCLIKFPWPPIHLCTVEATMNLEGVRLNLGRLYEKATGLQHEKAHRAMNDVLALYECYKWLKEQELI